jgi:hypothetical protein
VTRRDIDSDDLRTGSRTVRTITFMLWQTPDEAATGRASRYTHRQRRWWDWVDGLCESVGKTDPMAGGASDADRPPAAQP